MDSQRCFASKQSAAALHTLSQFPVCVVKDFAETLDERNGWGHGHYREPCKHFECTVLVQTTLTKAMSKGAKYSAGYELNVSRGVRLKFVALQMPVMVRFLRKFTAKFAQIQLAHKFRRWKDNYNIWKIQHLEELQKQTVAAIPIQAIIRGYNGRKRVSRMNSAAIEAVEEKRRWSMYQIQCFVKLWQTKFRAMRKAGVRMLLRQNMAATMIQKIFRGFLSKAHTVEVERLKLLRQLRKWSHGISNNLVNMKGRSAQIF
jgi:hypothetical protein